MVSATGPEGWAVAAGHSSPLPQPSSGILVWAKGPEVQPGQKRGVRKVHSDPWKFRVQASYKVAAVAIQESQEGVDPAPSVLPGGDRGLTTHAVCSTQQVGGDLPEPGLEVVVTGDGHRATKTTKGEGLYAGGHRYSTRRSTRDGERRHVGRTWVDDVAVDFIGDDQEVVFVGQVDDPYQFVVFEQSPGRIVGATQQEE